MHSTDVSNSPTEGRRLLRSAPWLLLWTLAVGPAAAQQDNPLLYELLDRINLLEQELRDLRGELEVLQYQRQRNPDLEALEQRLAALERRLEASGEEPGSMSSLLSDLPADETGDAPAMIAEEDPLLPLPQAPADVAPRDLPPPPPGAQQAFDRALEALREGRYGEAIDGFRRYVNVYPENRLTGSAHYRLGEAYYAERAFDQAEQEMLILGTRYPTHERIPDALLKLGFIYRERGDNARARQVLEKLQQTYPDSLAASLATEPLEQLR